MTLELDEEIRSHIDMALCDRMARGENREEAEGAVRREFGNVTQVKEITRSFWRWSWADAWAQQLRYAVRGLKHHRAFALGVIVTLAVGIGMATSVFTLANAVLLRRLPVNDQNRVVALHLLSIGKRDHLPLDVTQFASFRGAGADAE